MMNEYIKVTSILNKFEMASAYVYQVIREDEFAGCIKIINRNKFISAEGITKLKARDVLIKAEKKRRKYKRANSLTTCSECNEIKSSDNFYGAYRTTSTCKVCLKGISKNKEKRIVAENKIKNDLKYANSSVTLNELMKLDPERIASIQYDTYKESIVDKLKDAINKINSKEVSKINSNFGYALDETLEEALKKLIKLEKLVA